MTSITLGILECDELTPELKPEFESYGLMFERLFQSASCRLETKAWQFKRYNAVNGEFPAEIGECDAYLLTGSKVGVYDDVPWFEGLRTFVLSAYRLNVRLLGVCFGHQFLCHVLGGVADKAQEGWGIGVLEHRKSGNDSNSEQAAWLAFMPERLSLLYSHQDQVLSIPAAFSRIYGSEFCPNGACWEAGRVLTFQGHPEFTRDYSRRLMALRESRYPPETYQRATASLNLETDEAAVLKCFIKFIKGEDI